MELVGVPYDQVLENTESSKFKDLATKLEAIVSFDTRRRRLSYFFCFFSVITLFIVSCFEQSLALGSLLSLRISCVDVFGIVQMFFVFLNAPPNAEKLL